MTTPSQLLDRIFALPPLPRAVLELNRAARDERVGAAALVRILETDPPLAAAVLRAANSALYGSRVGSLADAVTRLGIAGIVRLATGIGVMRHLPSAECRTPNFWQHSVAVAQTARALATLVGRKESADAAFLVGLLHDIGMLALELAAPNEYQAVRDLLDRGEPRLEAERRALDLDHEIAGSKLLAAWALPDELYRSVGRHHAPDPADPVASLVHVADLLVRSRLPNSPADEAMSFSLPALPVYQALVTRVADVDLEGLTFQIDDELERAVAFVKDAFASG
jgi:putative nucleotidyltransferase with HDIG domain